MSECRSTAPTVYQLTLDVAGEVVTRWLFTYRVDESGTLKGMDVRGNERVVGSAMPFSLAECDDVPPDVEVDEELMEAHKRAEEDLTDQ